jgi:hypothetical protein
MGIACLMEVRGRAKLNGDQARFDLMDLVIEEEIEKLETVIRDNPGGG